jgi:glycosyltransferase involved in cell wall biosynthesis
MVDSKRPIVSVVMITYMHGAFVSEAINGVLMQQCDFDVELIIADDCSLDRTSAVIDNFKDHPNYKWINYIRHESNMGMMGNFIWALEQASGKYIALCEGDDYWTDPLKLQKQVDFLEANENTSGVYTNFDYLKNGVILEHQTPFPHNPKESIFLVDCVWSGPFLISQTATVVWRSSYVKYITEMIQLPNNLFLGGDNWIQCALFNLGKVAYYNKVCSVYRLHEGNITSKTNYTTWREVKKLRFFLSYIEDEILAIKTEDLLNYYINLFVNKRFVNVWKLLTNRDLSVGDILRWRLWVLKNKTPRF